MPAALRFDRFVLDPRERRLTCDGAPVELNARYFDALELLVGAAGSLVTKDRFLAQVWHGVPVTDEALTQCIRTLRQRLGDEATAPRFIETVPKHGYRFVAPVTPVDSDTAAAPHRVLRLIAAGTAGAGIAGTIGGICYGFLGAAPPSQGGPGALSALLVLICATVLVAVTGGAAVSAGIAAAERLSGHRWRWAIVGGALGGLSVGALVRLLGLDAFALLLGRSPGNITGGVEGLAIGSAVGLAAWLTARFAPDHLRRSAALAATVGGLTGAAIPLAGGRLMGGSLDLLTHAMPGARLTLAPLGALVGEPGFGPIAQAVTGAAEGALFAACIAVALRLVDRAR